MDNNNWRPNPSGGEPTMDAGGDWRSQLQADSRQRIVTKIMDTLKRHLPFSGQEGLQELEKIAVGFEEKIYTAATSQSDYLRKISLKMLTMETKNPMPNAMQSNSSNNGQNPPDPASQDSSANVGDWQEEIYQKIKALKDMYYLDLNDMYQKIAAKLHQNESLLQQQPHLQQGKNPQLEKLKAFKGMLERFISLLQVSKSNIQIGYKDKLGSYEKQIMSILNSNRPRKPIPPMQQGQALPPQNMHSMQQSQPPQSQMTQLQPLENQMNPQMQSLNLPDFATELDDGEVCNPGPVTPVQFL